MSAGGAGAEAADAEAQRRALLRELEQHRQRIEALLSPRQSPASRLLSIGGAGFPRSHTMRLILGEPLLLAALSGLALKLLGRKGAASLSLAASVARTVREILLSGRGGQIGPGSANGAVQPKAPADPPAASRIDGAPS